MAMRKNKKNLIFTKTFSCAFLPAACTMALHLNARTSAQLVLQHGLGVVPALAASSAGVVGVLVSLVERRDAQVNALIGQVQMDRKLLATH
ncbi:hypothetical protein [Comamonas thiooxydans]|uniref:hypothetical protein n=1 Tax=Comamonas thiooxydans TaxID=363952 RepID=UPI001E52616F|nr:hypothetical protein [Comamonas thiooxydans]